MVNGGIPVQGGGSLEVYPCRCGGEVSAYKVDEKDDMMVDYVKFVIKCKSCGWSLTRSWLMDDLIDKQKNMGDDYVNHFLSKGIVESTIEWNDRAIKILGMREIEDAIFWYDGWDGELTLNARVTVPRGSDLRAMAVSWRDDGLYFIVNDGKQIRVNNTSLFKHDSPERFATIRAENFGEVTPQHKVRLIEALTKFLPYEYDSAGDGGR